MDIKLKREYINKLLIDIINCKSSDEFYELSVRLYYRINELVFNLQNEKLKGEEDEKK